MADLQFPMITEYGDFVIMNETAGEGQAFVMTEFGDYVIFDNTNTTTGGGGGGATFIQMIIISG